MSNFFLPPLNLPRLSENGTVIGSSSNHTHNHHPHHANPIFGSSQSSSTGVFGNIGGAGSISARYASMRAAGVAAQGALSARTPRTGPVQLSPIKGQHQQQFQPHPPAHANPNSNASHYTSPYNTHTTMHTNNHMSLETAASEELQILNSAPQPVEPQVEPIQSSALIILPGYTGSDALLKAIRNHSQFRIGVDEKGKERIRKIVFTSEQANVFCQTEAGVGVDRSDEVVQEECDQEQKEAMDEDMQRHHGYEGSDNEDANEEAYEDDENDHTDDDAANGRSSAAHLPVASPTLLTTTTVDSLLGGACLAVEVSGPNVVRVLTEWIDDQDQRAYVHVSNSALAAENELHLLFTQFRDPIETTLALIKPDAIASGFFHSIMKRIEEEGFEIERMEESMRFSEEQAKLFYEEHASKAFYPLLVKFMSSGPLVALSLKKENAVLAWRQLIGSLNEPTSLRGLYATDGTRNAVHGSDSIASAIREIQLVFNEFCPSHQASFLLIKPDGMAHRDEILARLQAEQFDLTRIQLIERLSSEQVRLFFTNKSQWLQSIPPVEKATPASASASASPFNGSMTLRRMESLALNSSPDTGHLSPDQPQQHPTFEQLLDHLQRGPVLALEVKRAQCVRSLRRIVGGSYHHNFVDPEKARAADREALRAKYGKSVLMNAVYISPTIEEAKRDLEVMFKHRKMFPPMAASILIIKPDAISHTEQIVTRLGQAGFRIGRQKKFLLTPSQLIELFPLESNPAESPDADLTNEFATFMTSGPCHAIQLTRTGAIDELQRVVGSHESDIDVLKKTTPFALRAQFGANAIQDAVYAPSSADEVTRLDDLIFHHWYPEMESTFAFIKPDAYARKGAIDGILTRLRKEGFEVVRKSKVHLSVDQARAFYAEHDGRVFQPALVAFMTSGPSLAMELRKIDAIRGWRALLGPTDSTVAKVKAPNSLRAIYGTDGRRNACHGSDSPQSAEREIALVFDTFVPMIETTCCLLKPEALVSNVAKAMLKRILAEGFEVVKNEKMTLTPHQAMRFYAEHAGAFYFPDLLKYMTSGPVIALALRKENAVQAFRTLMGTTDSTVARRLQPNSLRALYGIDKKYNAVHGSESREAAIREVDLAFNSFSVGVQDTFAWIKPDASDKEEEIVHRLVEEGFTVIKSVRRTLSLQQAQEFYAEHAAAPFFDQLVRYMISGPVVGLILRKENAVRALRELCGPTSSIDAKASDPDSLRALYGTDALRNALHSSKAPEAAKREIDLVFTHFFVGLQSTLALLKPDAIAKQAEGPILDMIKAAGFEILRKKALSLTPDQARLFYDSHSHQPFFEPLVAFMSSGPIIAFELRKDDGVKAWRDLLGPTNSDTARIKAPKSIRALYGTDGRMNAGHGSDSIEAAQRELALVFDTFSSQLLTTSVDDNR